MKVLDILGVGDTERSWRRFALWTALGVLCALLIAGSSTAPSSAAGEKLCRFNITVPEGLSGYESDFSDLRVNAYMDWRHRQSPSYPNGAGYFQTLRVGDVTYPTSLSDADTVVPANPGAYWIIGNEPDAPKGQDNITPEVYADRYYALATKIRGLDPTAKIGFGSIVQATPLRLRYLDRAWNRLISDAGNIYAASALIDFWNVHAFLLNEQLNQWGADIPAGFRSSPADYTDAMVIWFGCVETDGGGNCTRYDAPDTRNLTTFEQLLRDFRGWLADRGERDKPVWITEYGSLFPELDFPYVPESETSAYMTGTFDVLRTMTDPNTGYSPDGDRLVQGWFWHSLNNVRVTGTSPAYGGSLYDPATTTRTSIGDAFVAYAGGIVAQADPFPAAVRAVYAGSGTYTLSATIGNKGNSLFIGGYDVAFYLGDPTAGGTQLGATQNVLSDLEGCGTTAKASVTVTMPSPSPWDIFVELTPTTPVNDADLGNNLQEFSGMLPRSFEDVPPGSWQQKWVEALVASSVTAGCSTNPDLYCPTQDVTRAQMAVFLLKGIHGSTYTPPPAAGGVFSDIDGHWAQDWIEELANEGLTGGFPDGTYRPDQTVTRAQTAVFLLTAEHGSGYTPDGSATSPFTDISGHWAEDWINQLYAEGLTAGYPDGTFRPDTPVNRSEMAVFLVNTFGLPIP